jgi:conjugal transfer/type IV secretion protein DotA/TraY
MPKAQKEPACTTLPDNDFAENQINRYQTAVRQAIDPLIDQARAQADWSIGVELKKKGWAGASIWYNRLAQMNGDISTAIYAQPIPSKYPDLMELIAEQRRLQNSALNPAQMFNPSVAEGENIKYRSEADMFIATPLNIAYTFWEGKTEKKSENIFIDTINLIFGTDGIFNMRKNANIHPLAQLSALGKSMMEASIRNFGMGFLGGGASQLFPGYIGSLGKAASGFLQTIGMTTMAMSFVLFYILPLMPFLYFLFALSSWLKSIFEAVVAMPLWALAHIVRMDGSGMPGPAATNGYFLLLEIFIRPVLIVFGLIGSIIIFSSLIKTLNSVFDMAVNIGGVDHSSAAITPVAELIEKMRGPIDEFFFTAVYVIICYILGLSCFKLIDQVPAKILRWAGVSVNPFEDGSGDSASQLLQKTYGGSLVVTGQLKGGQLALLK